MNYLRLRDLNERRQVRIVVAGAAVTLIAYVPFVAINALPRWDIIRRLVLGIPANLRFVIVCMGCAFPISIAYAILRHRMFDILVMIRLGLQYAAARGAMLSLVPIVGVVFVGDLLFHGRTQPLMQILGQRGWLYAVLADGAAYRLRVSLLPEMD